MAKLEICMRTTSPAFPVYSLHMLEHEVLEHGVREFSREKGQQDAKPDVRDVYNAITTYIKACAWTYFLSTAVMYTRYSPDIVYSCVMTLTTWRELGSKIAEVLDLVTHQGVKELREPPEKCRCSTGSSPLVLDVEKIVTRIAECEVPEEPELRENKLYYNAIVIVDGMYVDAVRVPWLTASFENIKKFVTEAVTRSSREIVAVLFLDVLYPQTLTYIHISTA